MILISFENRKHSSVLELVPLLSVKVTWEKWLMWLLHLTPHRTHTHVFLSRDFRDKITCEYWTKITNDFLFIFNSKVIKMKIIFWSLIINISIRIGSYKNQKFQIQNFSKKCKNNQKNDEYLQNIDKHILRLFASERRMSKNAKCFIMVIVICHLDFTKSLYGS